VAKENLEVSEGMSSEELDALTTGEVVENEDDPKLAKEALEAIGEDPDETEVAETEDEKAAREAAEAEALQADPKDAVIGQFRREKRDLELENAKLQGELEARKSLQTDQTQKVKSPLELAEDAYTEEYGSLDGFAMSGELYRQQEAWKDKQTAQKTTETQESSAMQEVNREKAVLQNGDLSPEKAGAGLDFKSVIDNGQDYLDEADVLKVKLVKQKLGTNAGLRKAYDLCKQALIDNGQLKAKTKPQPKPNSETDIDALTTEDDDAITGEAEDLPHSERIANFICG
jgi:hypothetical protein